MLCRTTISFETHKNNVDNELGNDSKVGSKDGDGDSNASAEIDGDLDSGNDIVAGAGGRVDAICANR